MFSATAGVTKPSGPLIENPEAEILASLISISAHPTDAAMKMPRTLRNLLSEGGLDVAVPADWTEAGALRSAFFTQVDRLATIAINHSQTRTSVSGSLALPPHGIAI